MLTGPPPKIHGTRDILITRLRSGEFVLGSDNAAHSCASMPSPPILHVSSTTFDFDKHTFGAEIPTRDYLPSADNYIATQPSR